jgi:hypothetical protein
MATTPRSKKALLRSHAVQALDDAGYEVVDVGGRGVAPWVRLRIVEGEDVKQAAVRTAVDRKVGLIRHSNGLWKTIPEVDIVVVAAPSTRDSEVTEVFFFKREVFQTIFDGALAELKKRSPKFSSKSPVFVPLDGKPGKPSGARPLKDLCEWRRSVSPDGDAPSGSPRILSDEEFIEKCRREIAQRLGIDPSQLEIVRRY